MNAIVALCHFCEAHGPCILFCTQAFHSAHDAQLLMDAVPPEKRLPPPLEHLESESSLSSLMHPPPKSSDQCEACRSVPVDQPGFISYDPKAQISYISGQYPEQPQQYSILRQACVRSLNCEVCPGREGPIVFGEDGGCHVLSHTFHLRDSQARGFNRLYSFVVVMMDRVFLINSWPFLVKHLRAVIDDLQAKAEGVYNLESEGSKSSTTRPLRTSLSSLQGPDHLRRIRTNQAGRSLIELTGDSDVFVYLHRYFIFLLKAGGQRITECVLEGPPQVMATPETPPTSSQEREGGDDLDRPLSAGEFSVVSVEGQPGFLSLRHLFQVIERRDFMELASHVLRGNQVVVRGSDVTTVTSIINVIKDLVPEVCCRIVGFSQSYKESFVCNFLGLAVGVALPPHVAASEQHVLVDVLPPLKRHYSLARGEKEGPAPDRLDPLFSYKILVNSGHRNSEPKYPLFLHRLVALLSTEVFSEAIICQSLQSLKEEWMNKVKVFFKFSQMGHLDLPQKNERLGKLVSEILLVGWEELPLLQYWRMALSKEYRTHLMRTAHESP